MVHGSGVEGSDFRLRGVPASSAYSTGSITATRTRLEGLDLNNHAHLVLGKHEVAKMLNSKLYVSQP